MTTAEFILARATAKGGQYEAYVSGGVVQFTSAEVGHALAGFKREDEEFEPLPDGSFRILLLKYASGDESDARALALDLWENTGEQMAWILRVGHMAICRAVVSEFLRAPRCDACQGRQMVMDDELLTLCKACDGAGYRPSSDASRAADLGIPVRTFQSSSAKTLYAERLKRLVRWEDMGLRRVVAKIRG